jgi:transposase
MRFVPLKNIEQQAMLALHRARQGFVSARTAQANQIRGLLSEYGIVIPQGIAHIAERVPEIIEDGANELPGLFRQLVQRLMDHLKALYRQVAEIDAEIKAWHRQIDLCRKREKRPGIGPVTATALVATIGDAKHFENGRQLAAWLGLVPRQHSKWWTAKPAGHQQARGLLSPNAADSWCPFSDPLLTTQRRAARLGA